MQRKKEYYLTRKQNRVSSFYMLLRLGVDELRIKNIFIRELFQDNFATDC